VSVGLQGNSPAFLKGNEMFVDKEEMMLRELAAGRCVIPKVTAELGPMSLWSKAGFDAEIRKAVEAEREACAKVCEDSVEYAGDTLAKAIRARGEV
jgi:hypothetical protein